MYVRQTRQRWNVPANNRGTLIHFVREGKEEKGKERKGKERKGKERKGKGKAGQGKEMIFSNHNGSLLRRQLRVFCVRACTSQAIAGVKFLPTHHVNKYFSCPFFQRGGNMMTKAAADVIKAWWMHRTYVLLGATVLDVHILRLFVLLAERHTL